MSSGGVLQVLSSMSLGRTGNSRFGQREVQICKRESLLCVCWFKIHSRGGAGASFGASREEQNLRSCFFPGRRAVIQKAEAINFAAQK